MLKEDLRKQEKKKKKKRSGLVIEQGSDHPVHEEYTKEEPFKQ